MEVNNTIIITACVVGFIVIGWLFNISLSKILKLILNSILGGILIYLINYFGASIGMHIGLNVVTSVFVGFFGILGALLLLAVKLF